jgi:hypothetical protein
VRDVTQIMPAPGWRIIFCYRPGQFENGKVVIPNDGEILFEDMPVVGWGVVRVHDEDGEEDHNEVELLTIDECGVLVEPVSEFFRLVSGGVHHLLSPNQELTDELKQEWAEELKRQLEWEAKRRNEKQRRKLAAPVTSAA